MSHKTSPTTTMLTLLLDKINLPRSGLPAGCSELASRAVPKALRAMHSTVDDYPSPNNHILLVGGGAVLCTWMDTSGDPRRPPRT